MKCFVPMDEDAILKLWVKNPKLVAPFSRPFYPSAFSTDQARYPTEVSALLEPKKKLGNKSLKRSLATFFVA